MTVRSTGVPELVEALKQENAALRDRVENDRKKYEMVCKHADEQVATLRAELSVERDYRKAANETEAALRAELDKRKAYESTFHKTLGELRTELTTHAIHRFCVSRTKYDALRAQLEALRDEGRRNRVELQKELDALRDEAEELNAALTTKDDEWIVSQGYQALVEAARDFVGYCDNCGGTGKVGDSDCRWCTPTRAALKAIEERR